jgi:glutamate/tyrosine decarboxylase-like PLP-dependent enzyme
VCSGSYDDFKTICKAANKANAWVHIDGAFGLWALASERFDKLTKGIELADSWSADGHKTLNTPYDCGAIFCKHPVSLTEALHQQGSYIAEGNNRDSMTYTPDMSRRARGIDLWACLHHLGKKGVQDLVEHLHTSALFMQKGLSAVGFKIDNDVHFNQVIIRAEGDAKTKRILQDIQRKGVIWCGSAMWKGNFVIRLSICSWQTNQKDLELALKEFERAYNN